jgi:hypothetical protein
MEFITHHVTAELKDMKKIWQQVARIGRLLVATARMEYKKIVSVELCKLRLFTLWIFKIKCVFVCATYFIIQIAF